MAAANVPPSANMTVMEAMYRSAMRLWSVVSSHDFTP
jgi:hypothetical protein